jgi:hypothetical protein
MSRKKDQGAKPHARLLARVGAATRAVRTAQIEPAQSGEPAGPACASGYLLAPAAIAPPVRVLLGAGFFIHNSTGAAIYTELYVPATTPTTIA